jgi:ribosomal protein S12 methylthiotransferase
MSKNIDKVSILTLGCAKNLVDSESIIGLLKANGIEYTEDINDADAAIINTCGFIKPAKQESVNVIFETLNLKKKGKLQKVIVSGCFSERYGKDLKGQLPGVDHIFGLNAGDQILKSLKSSKMYFVNFEREILTPKHYAYLKISEGCDHECSFCAIPFIRGNHVSRKIEDLVDESKKLVDKGIKEINIIAQDTTNYGFDLYKKRRIVELVDKISSESGAEWIRVLYAYPTTFQDDLLSLMNERKNICKYVDIPLQHASNRMLKLMKRGMNQDKTLELLIKMRNTVDGISIRSGFIVGYPQESQQDFEDLKRFLEIARLDRVGVFTYSHEENTSAFNFPDDVPEKLKIKRRDELMKTQQKISLQKNLSKIDKEFKVLIDDFDGENYIGRTEFDAPDVDNSVIIKADKEYKTGDFVNVKITSAQEYDLFGEVTN